MSCTLFSNFRGDPWQWPVKSFTQTCRHTRIGHYNICMTKKDGSKHEWSKKHLGCHTLMWYPYPHFFWFLIADMSWHINFHSILYLTSLFPKYTQTNPKENEASAIGSWAAEEDHQIHSALVEATPLGLGFIGVDELRLDPPKNRQSGSQLEVYLRDGPKGIKNGRLYDGLFPKLA